MPDSDRDTRTKRTLIVPGQPPAPAGSGTGDDEGRAFDEGLVRPADLGSASRSCLAIIVVLIVIALLLCIFLVVQTVSG